MFFTCHFQEEHSSLYNKNYVESIFILYRIKYQKIKIDLTSPLSTYTRWMIILLAIRVSVKSPIDVYTAVKWNYRILR